MSIRLQHRSLARERRQGQLQLRWVTRVALLGAIAAIALYRGYTPQNWLLVGVAVAWAASLPFMIRGIWRQLREREQMPSWQRTTVMVICALVLLLGFAVGAKILVGA